MRLTPFTPRFFGTVVVEGQEVRCDGQLVVLFLSLFSSDLFQYMSMENLMRGMEEVCIIDLKVQLIGCGNCKVNSNSMTL